MKPQRIKSISHTFTDAEYNALICVLPLCTYVGKLAVDKKEAFRVTCAKVAAHISTYSSTELDILISSVSLSIQLLSGNAPGLLADLAPEAAWLAQMRSYFFVLNSLNRQFQQLKDFGEF